MFRVFNDETLTAFTIISKDTSHYVAINNFLFAGDNESALKYIIDLITKEMSPGEIGCVDLDAIVSTFLGV